MRLKERLSHGVKVLVTGTPLMNAECFTINFLTPMEHFFHFRVNFSVGNEKVCLSTFLRILKFAENNTLLSRFTRDLLLLIVPLFSPSLNLNTCQE